MNNTIIKDVFKLVIFVLILAGLFRAFEVFITIGKSNHEHAISIEQRYSEHVDSAFYFVTIYGGEYMVVRNAHVIYKIVDNGYKPIPIDSLTNYMK